MRARTGSGKGGALAFLVIFGVGAIVAMYLNQKPKVVERTVVVQPPPPPPVVQETPAPAPIPPPKIETPVPVIEPVRAPVAIPAPPPVPECQIIEAKLQDAQRAEAQAQVDLAVAKQVAIDKVQSSPDYIAAKTDASTKKAAVTSLVEKLRSDEQSMTETDDEKASVRAAEASWLEVDTKLAQMKDDAVAADSSIAEKQKAIKDDAATVASLQKALSDYIQGDITTATQGADCPIKSVAIDTASETISVGLNQRAQNDVGGGTDLAMATIGRILERSMRKSAYTWSSAVFTVYFDYNGGKAVEFQAKYSRSTVDAANFAMTIDRGNYLDDQGLVNLAQELWFSPIISGAQQANSVELASGAGAQYGNPGVQYADPSVSAAYINGVWYDVLVIGGYRRADGSFCLPVYIRRPHRKEDAHDARLQPPSASQSRQQQAAPPQSGSLVRPTPAPNQPQKPATPPKNTTPAQPQQQQPVVKPG